jgi:hypothetical protein
MAASSQAVGNKGVLYQQNGIRNRVVVLARIMKEAVVLQ